MTGAPAGAADLPMRHALRMPRAVGPALVAALALLLTSGGSPASAPGGGRPLPPREPAGVVPQGLLGTAPAGRSLRTGEGHGWLVRLEAGDFALLRIEQLGADVEVALFDPTGRFLFEIDTMTPSGWDGEEQLFLHARATGLHRLELRAIDDAGPEAAYRARVVERRPATRTDLLRVRAAERFQGATALRLAGRHRQALPLIEEAEELFGRLGDERFEAESRAQRCALRFNLGDYEVTLAAAERRGDPAGAARALTAIGKIHEKTGDPDEAIRRYRLALARARAAGDRELTGDLYYNLAWLTGERVPEDRIPHLERALAEYRAAGNRRAQIVTLLALAGAERGEGKLHAGLQRLETARILFAELRERLPDPELRLSFMAHRYRLFDAAVDLLMELHLQHPGQGWDLRALEMSEQARARGLLDLLSPAAGTAEVLSAGEIQSRLLDSGTVLLEYKLGDERSHLWVVEHDRVESFELPPRERLESLARAFHDRLDRPPGIAAAAALERTGVELSRALLCPARERLDGRRWIVAAEGELLYLSFAALGLEACGGDAAGRAPAAGRPVVVAPSASALAALRERSRPPPEHTLAVIADPVFDACDTRLDGHRRGHDCPAGYPRLLHGAREARAILGLVPPGERIAVTGFDVRRERVEEAIASARYVHFATHADTAANPPRLVLSRVDRHGRPLAPGHLSAEDASRLSLAADLVVLGACDTNAGRSFRGEGLVGLAHAFFEAGAGAVVVTLWPVDDEATAALMGRFYRHLLAGGSTPAAALAAAQREMSSQPRWRPPYYWAGFTLLGDGI